LTFGGGPVLRLGILGTPSIAERALITPSRLVPGVVVVAVASRDRSRASDFGRAHGLPRVLESYEALISDPEVDAVYVALPAALHAEWAVRAAAAGKHVLVEKPLALSTASVDAVARAASATGVLVMEAISPAHHPWQAAVRSIIGNGDLGPLARLETELAFTPPQPGNYRWRRELGGGICRDAAPYWIQFLQAAAGDLRIDNLDVHTEQDPSTGVDVRCAVEAALAGGVVARGTFAFSERHVAEHRLYFERGTLRHSGFLRPTLGPFRVNLHVNPAAGEGRVISFPPQGYFEAQLAAFVEATRRGTDRDQLMECRARAELMDRLAGGPLA
jgi:dTDP-3,4-didehydro-2,6-dideoxy-alpha-D-glucose 3-reductase